MEFKADTLVISKHENDYPDRYNISSPLTGEDKGEGEPSFILPLTQTLSLKGREKH